MTSVNLKLHLAEECFFRRRGGTFLRCLASSLSTVRRNEICIIVKSWPCSTFAKNLLDFMAYDFEHFIRLINQKVISWSTFQLQKLIRCKDVKNAQITVNSFKILATVNSQFFQDDATKMWKFIFFFIIEAQMRVCTYYLPTNLPHFVCLFSVIRVLIGAFSYFVSIFFCIYIEGQSDYFEEH